MNRSPLIRLGAAAAILVLGTLATAGCTKKSDNEAAGATTRAADQVKIALVPGGAHPYFQPWKDDRREGQDRLRPRRRHVQRDRRLGPDQAERRAQVAGRAGLQRVRHLRRLAGEHQLHLRGPEAPGLPRRLARLLPGRRRQQGRLLPLHRRRARPPTRPAKAAIEAMGGAGQPGPPDRQQGRLQHPAPDRRRAEGRRRDRRQGQAAPDRSPTSTRTCRPRRRPSPTCSPRRAPRSRASSPPPTTRPSPPPRRSSRPSCRSRSSRSTTTRPSSPASGTARSPARCCRTRSARRTSGRTR